MDPWRPSHQPHMHLAMADPQTRLLVWALRRWLDGVCGQNEVWSHLASRLGGKRAHRALGDFESFLIALSSHAHQPLERAPTCCPILAEDEAKLGSLLRLATCGERRAAVAVSGLLVSEGAEEIADLAASIGEAFAEAGPPEMTMRARTLPKPLPVQGERTLH